MFIFEPTEGFWTIKFLNILNIRERNKKTWGLPTALYQAHIKHEVSPRSRKSPSDLSWEEDILAAFVFRMQVTLGRCSEPGTWATDLYVCTSIDFCLTRFDARENLIFFGITKNNCDKNEKKTFLFC